MTLKMIMNTDNGATIVHDMQNPNQDIKLGYTLESVNVECVRDGKIQVPNFINTLHKGALLAEMRILDIKYYKTHYGTLCVNVKVKLE